MYEDAGSLYGAADDIFGDADYKSGHADGSLADADARPKMQTVDAAMQLSETPVYYICRIDPQAPCHVAIMRGRQRSSGVTPG